MTTQPSVLLSCSLATVILGAFPVQQRAVRPADRATMRSGVVVMGPPRAEVPRLFLPGFSSTNVNVTRDVSAQNETSIALDPSNPTNLVAGSNDYRYGDAQAGVAVSSDGGERWTSNTLAGLDPALGKYDGQGDPCIVSYPGGVYYYSFIDFSRTDEQNRLAVARSTDGGVTWPQLGVVIDHAGAGGHDFEDKEFIAVDDSGSPFDGNLYVAWTRYLTPSFLDSNNRVMISVSTNDGASFSAPAQISDTIGDYQGTFPVVGPGGELYVAWYHASAIEVDVSTNGGASFGTDVNVAAINDISNPIPGTFFRVFSFPALAVDRSGGPNDGNLYVVWADELGTGSGPDILLSRSTDGGATWSPPIRVSDDTNSSYQFMPAIAVAPDGTVVVSFFDQRDTPGSTEYDIYAARSTNGGRSFRRNRRISNRTSDSLLDGFGGFFIGDYSGIAVTRYHAFPCWTDTRPANSNAEGYVLGVRHRFRRL